MFFFKDPATTELYTLPLHVSLPIGPGRDVRPGRVRPPARVAARQDPPPRQALHRPAASGKGHGPAPVRRAAPAPPDRKSTRLNSSHANISYAVFCLNKKLTNSQLRP